MPRTGYLASKNSQLCRKIMHFLFLPAPQPLKFFYYLWNSIDFQETLQEEFASRYLERYGQPFSISYCKVMTLHIFKIRQPNYTAEPKFTQLILYIAFFPGLSLLSLFASLTSRANILKDMVGLFQYFIAKQRRWKEANKDSL